MRTLTSLSEGCSIDGDEKLLVLQCVRLIATHPSMAIATLTSERSAGKKFGDVFQQFRPLSKELPDLVRFNNLLLE